MKFKYRLQGDIISGQAIMKNDGSLLFEPRPINANFSILLSGNWRYSLEIDYRNGQCLYITLFCDEDIYIIDNLPIFNSNKGIVLFENSEMSFGSGCHYEIINLKSYFDKKNGTIFIGDLSKNGNIIEFADNIYAVIKNNNLYGIYIKNIKNISNHIKKEKDGKIIFKKLR